MGPDAVPTSQRHTYVMGSDGGSDGEIGSGQRRKIARERGTERERRERREKRDERERERERD